MVETLPANAGDTGLISSPDRCPEEGNGYVAKILALCAPMPNRNMETELWRSLVGYSPLGREELDTTEQLTFTFHFQ